MSHIYSNRFYDYIEVGARSSARVTIGLLNPLLGVTSLVDLGAGRGVWPSEWSKAGVTDVAAVDGDYVDREQLAVPQAQFHCADLSLPVDLGRRFDLAQSLEVGEHLPKGASAVLVESLTRHADRVLFSAAVPGQGGEFHINEQPLAFWQQLFARQGYRAFDCLRPKLRDLAGVEPWYRYNTIFYANEEGRKGLPAEILDYEIPIGQPVPPAGNFRWRLRLRIVSLMPRRMVTFIAQIRAAILARNTGAKKKRVI